jgi:hypothetical protein
LANAIEDAGNRRPGFQRALGGELIDETVRERVGERNAEFENVDTGILQCEREIDRARQIGIARTDIRDECFFVLLPKGCETLVDSIWHRR